MRFPATLALVLAVSQPSAPRADQPPASPEAEWSAWREKRRTNLTREDGWLALVGLHWLSPGENRIEGLPGTWVVEGAKVKLLASPSDGWTLDGAAVSSRELAPDSSGKPDRLRNGARQLQVIERSGKYALRVWDAASPARTSFRGIDTFPYAPRWRIEAAWEAFPAPKEVETPTVTGTPAKEQVPGRARFVVDGKAYTLEPTQEAPGEDLFFVFRDQTARKETYGAGRFLYAKAPKDGKVVLDFNRAYNPPCAFTPHATCPLPRPENVIAIRVEAGEKRWDDPSAHAHP